MYKAEITEAKKGKEGNLQVVLEGEGMCFQEQHLQSNLKSGSYTAVTERVQVVYLKSSPDLMASSL